MSLENLFYTWFVVACWKYQGRCTWICQYLTFLYLLNINVASRLSQVAEKGGGITGEDGRERKCGLPSPWRFQSTASPQKESGLCWGEMQADGRLQGGTDMGTSPIITTSPWMRACGREQKLANQTRGMTNRVFTSKRVALCCGYGNVRWMGSCQKSRLPGRRACVGQPLSSLCPAVHFPESSNCWKISYRINCSISMWAVCK